MASEYVVIRDGRVVQEIDAEMCDPAYAQKNKDGDLYVKCGPADPEVAVEQALTEAFGKLTEGYGHAN